eukprot:gene1897-2030_t
MANKYSSLFDLLKNEPKLVINKIYSASNTSIWSCQAIFQSLTPLSRYIILRLLFLNTSFKLSEIYLMINKSKENEIELLFDELIGLDILTEDTNITTTTQSHNNSQRQNTNSSIPSDLIDLTDSSSSSSLLGKRSIESRYRGNDSVYRLNTCFQKSLVQAMTQPTNPWEVNQTQQVASTLKLMSVSKEFLEEYRLNEWNKVLSYLLNILPDSTFTTSLIPTFLTRFGLMTKSPPSSSSLSSSSSNNNTMMITAKGYEFLLKDYYHQIWDFVIVALQSINKEENLSLLFLLSFTEYGKYYTTSLLTKSQNIFLFELSQIGIIYLPDGVNSKVFYPTNIIINLIFGITDLPVGGGGNGSGGHLLGYRQSHQTSSTSSSSSALAASYFSSPILNDNNDNVSTGNATSSSLLGGGTGDDHRHRLTIIVETNLQVTAYVTNDLHVALLRLFIDIHIRFPNMIIGRITREKSKQAFKTGIKSSQMIDFLMIHAHPITKTRLKIIPDNVIDQLILWESELYRIQSITSRLFDFTTLFSNKKELYYELKETLSSSNLILWEDEKKMIFVCHPLADNMIKQFLQRKATLLF